MKVRVTRRFSKDYKKLSLDIQKRLDRKLEFLLNNPRHPSLRMHKIQGSEGVWEFSITMNYRVIFEIVDDCYVLLGVGPHDILDDV